MDWSYFKDKKEAVEATDEMIAANRVQHSHIDPAWDKETTVCPHLTSKFWYTHQEGIGCPIIALDRMSLHADACMLIHLLSIT